MGSTCAPRFLRMLYHTELEVGERMSEPPPTRSIGWVANVGSTCALEFSFNATPENSFITPRDKCYDRGGRFLSKQNMTGGGDPQQRSYPKYAWTPACGFTIAFVLCLGPSEIVFRVIKQIFFVSEPTFGGGGRLLKRGGSTILGAFHRWHASRARYGHT